MERYIKFSDLEAIIEEREARGWRLVEEGTEEKNKIRLTSGFAITGEYIALRGKLNDLWGKELGILEEEGKP